MIEKIFCMFNKDIFGNFVTFELEGFIFVETLVTEYFGE